MRFSFVHAADFHLGSPFTGVARSSPRVAAELRDASLAAFDALVAFTLQREAAFLVIAGDVFDSTEASIRAQLRFARGLERLDRAGVQTLIAHGNHDPLDGRRGTCRWPESVHTFGASHVECVPVVKDGVRLASVCGISFGAAAVRENLARRFQLRGEPGLSIGVLHCSVGSGDGHEPYSPCEVSDLAATGYDYWALGHIHQYTQVSKGDPWIIYPGALQGRSPKPSELGAKGAVVVEVEDDRVARVSFEALDVLRFVELNVPIEGVNDIRELRDELYAAACQRQSEEDGRGLVVRCVLYGRGPLHRDLKRVGVLEGLLTELRAECESQQPLLWWESVKALTGRRLDDAELLRRDDFLSQLLRLTNELCEAPPDLETFMDESTALLARRALSQWSAERHGEAAETLVRVAAEEAIDRLKETLDDE